MIHRPTRRDMLKYGASAAGAAMLPQLRGPFRSSVASIPADQLEAADISYLGLFKLPLARASDLNGSRASMTARYVGGDLRFLIQGNNFKLLEVSYPGQNTVYASAPRATEIQYISDIGSPAALVAGAPAETPIVWGLHWDEATDRLWWTYSTNYEGTSNNPSLAVTELLGGGSIDFHGPWRTQSGSGVSCGYMMEIPAWFQAYTGGKTHLLGNPPHAGNAAAPFGANLRSWTPVADGTTPDVTTNTNWTIGAQALMFHGIANPQPRTNNYKSCGWNVPYDPAFGGFTNPGTSVFGGPDSGQLLDWMDSCAWIDLADKKGIIYFGQLADTISGHTYGGGDTVTHLWYGPGTCVHGQVAAAHLATGPGAGTLCNQVWIYNPNDLIAVAQGTDTADEPLPVSTFRASDLGGFISELRTKLGQFGGAWFDSTTRKLFLAEKEREVDGCCNYMPVIHVFEIL